MAKKRKHSAADLAREEAEYDKKFRQLLFETVMKCKEFNCYGIIPLPRAFLARWVELNQTRAAAK
jgi:hypothetical protein